MNLGRVSSAALMLSVTWLGAAAVRLASLAVDRARTNSAFWGYLAAEIGFGTTALVSAAKRRS